MNFQKYISLIVFAGAGVALVVIGYALFFLAPPNSELMLPIDHDLLLSSSISLMQKPGDRFVFFGIVLSLPLLAVSIFLIARLCSIRVDIAQAFLLLNALLIVLLICGGYFSLLSGLWQSTGFFLIAAFFVLFSLYVTGITKHIQKLPRQFIVVSAIFLAGAFLLFQRVWTVESVSYNSWYISHGEAVLYSIFHASVGGTCLVSVVA